MALLLGHIPRLLLDQAESKSGVEKTRMQHLKTYHSKGRLLDYKTRIESGLVWTGTKFIGPHSGASLLGSYQIRLKVKVGLRKPECSTLRHTTLTVGSQTTLHLGHIPRLLLDQAESKSGVEKTRVQHLKTYHSKGRLLDYKTRIESGLVWTGTKFIGPHSGASLLGSCQIRLKVGYFWVWKNNSGTSKGTAL